MPKKFYVTKKQVDYFIKHHENSYSSLDHFKTNLETNIADLENFPEENKYQIKFFNRVLIRVCQLTLIKIWKSFYILYWH